MALTALLLALATSTGDDEFKIETKSWRIDTAYVVRFYLSGPLVDNTLEFRTPYLDKIVVGKQRLKQRRGNLDLPEKLTPGDQLRVSTQVAFPKRGEVEVFDRIEGRLPVLAGGELHETVFEGKGFRHKRKKKLNIPALKEQGGGLSVWTSQRDAIVFRVQGRKDRVDKLDLEYQGPVLKSYGESGKDPYLAYFPEGKKPVKGLTLVVHRDDGSTVKIKDWKVGKEVKILEHEALRNAGIEITLGKEPRDVLHLISHGNDTPIYRLDLQTEAGPLECENARLVPGLTDHEDQWIYPSIPADAVLEVVVRAGAEWREVPFTVTNVRVD